MVAVTVRELTKVFDGGAMAVDHLDLDIRTGEFMVLLGPAGSGKTTLLRLIGGLEAATSGEVLVDGVPVADLPAREQRIALLFQSYSIYPHLTVAQNIGFPLRAGSEPSGDVAGRVAEAARHLGHRRPAQPAAVAPVPRPAAAGGDGPGDRTPPRAAAAGRAAVQRGCRRSGPSCAARSCA